MNEVRCLVCKGLKRKSNPHPRHADAWGGLRFHKHPTAEPILKHVGRVMALWDWSQKPQFLGSQERVPWAKPGQGGCLASLKTPQRPGTAVDGVSQLPTAISRDPLWPWEATAGEQGSDSRLSLLRHGSGTNHLSKCCPFGSMGPREFLENLRRGMRNPKRNWWNLC